jgi:hypothetical protein
LTATSGDTQCASRGRPAPQPCVHQRSNPPGWVQALFTTRAHTRWAKNALTSLRKSGQSVARPGFSSVRRCPGIYPPRDRRNHKGREGGAGLRNWYRGEHSHAFSIDRSVVIALNEAASAPVALVGAVPDRYGRPVCVVALGESRLPVIRTSATAALLRDGAGIGLPFTSIPRTSVMVRRPRSGPRAGRPSNVATSLTCSSQRRLRGGPLPDYEAMSAGQT